MKYAEHQNNSTFISNTKLLPVPYLCVLVLDVEDVWQVVWLLASLEEEWCDQRWDEIIL